MNRRKVEMSLRIQLLKNCEIDQAWYLTRKKKDRCLYRSKNAIFKQLRFCFVFSVRKIGIQVGEIDGALHGAARYLRDLSTIELVICYGGNWCEWNEAETIHWRFEWAFYEAEWTPESMSNSTVAFNDLEWWIASLLWWNWFHWAGGMERAALCYVTGCLDAVGIHISWSKDRLKGSGPAWVALLWIENGVEPNLGLMDDSWGQTCGLTIHGTNRRVH